MGLDRLLMLRKGIPDIRILRSADVRITRQMNDLEPYRPVSNLPALTRDLSVAISVDDDAEQLGDRIRSVLRERADILEAVTILFETRYAVLPPSAQERLGMNDTQKNVLVRLDLRPMDRTLTDAEANSLRDDVYEAIHEGSTGQWAGR